jgi:hypothetical protein
MTKKKFATAVNCIDGRTQIPVIDFVRTKTGVSYVDMVTEPGVVKLLSEQSNTSTLESLKERVCVSIEGHSSKHIWIAAHHDCAANPAEREKQIKQMRWWLVGQRRSKSSGN